MNSLLRGGIIRLSACLRGCCNMSLWYVEGLEATGRRFYRFSSFLPYLSHSPLITLTPLNPISTMAAAPAVYKGERCWCLKQAGRRLKRILEPGPRRFTISCHRTVPRARGAILGTEIKQFGVYFTSRSCPKLLLRDPKLESE